MNRTYYLELAAARPRIPIGADLVLHDEPDPEAVRRDGRLLGRVVERAARRYRSPLAIPLMDLRLEKADLLAKIGIAEEDADSFQFSEPPGEDVLGAVRAGVDAPFAAANRAQHDAIRYIAEHTDLLPVGMLIGPFSLMTKLLRDPISPVAMAGLGVTAEEDPAVRLAERALGLAEMAIARSLAAQAKAGARLINVCEPAANTVYVSPKQMAAGADVFERFVIAPNRRLKQRMADAGVDLMFHDCGELNDTMVELFAKRLDPVILSFGSSRKLWEDARLVPDHIVLFGNLPTKTFYSDAGMPIEEVERRTCELLRKMAATGHPHILGSECDVLAVAEAHETICRKVERMLTCACA